MHERAFRRALALGAGALLLVTTTALADTVQPSTDGVTPVAGGTIDLGTLAPGATASVDVSFIVSCAGWPHIDPGAFVMLGTAVATAPLDGAISALGATIGQAPADWPSTGDCTNPPQTFGGGAPSHISVTAPTTPSAPGKPYSIPLQYPVSTSSGGGVGMFAYATVEFAVSGDQPPVLQLPSDTTVEGNTTGGATVTWTATATDAEDTTAPTATCSPASGSFFALGSTTVSCSATDSANQTATGSFGITVVDMTPPSLSGLPAPISVTTYDAGGAVATYPLPTATDVVDPSPAVTCAPASGMVFPVGSTSVSCTATDHSGNTSLPATFAVTVTQVHLAAIFEAPIGPSNTLAINPGRTLPVKATITADGVPVTAGSVTLDLASCGAATTGASTWLAFADGRWFLGLDTIGLSGCVTGTLRLDGHAAGSFSMDARGSPTTTGRPRHPH